MNYIREKLLYKNPLERKCDVEGFVLEGQAQITFENQRLRIRNTMDEALGQAANMVYWCPEYFPDCIEINWDFFPCNDKGLCVFFFAATGRHGEDLFHHTLTPRTGEYDAYHSGDINTLHISYYRRMYEAERAFQVANLRKSYGFHLVAQGADPIPYPEDARPPYHMRVVKYKERVDFYINDLKILDFTDTDEINPYLQGGKIGFRQMSPFIGEYSQLYIYAIRKEL